MPEPTSKADFCKVSMRAVTRSLEKTGAAISRWVCGWILFLARKFMCRGAEKDLSPKLILIRVKALSFVANHCRIFTITWRKISIGFCERMLRLLGRPSRNRQLREFFGNAAGASKSRLSPVTGAATERCKISSRISALIANADRN